MLVIDTPSDDVSLDTGSVGIPFVDTASAGAFVARPIPDPSDDTPGPPAITCEAEDEIDEMDGSDADEFDDFADVAASGTTTARVAGATASRSTGPGSVPAARSLQGPRLPDAQELHERWCGGRQRDRHREGAAGAGQGPRAPQRVLDLVEPSPVRIISEKPGC